MKLLYSFFILLSFYYLITDGTENNLPPECFGIEMQTVEISFILWKKWMESREIEMPILRKMWSFEYWKHNFCRQQVHNWLYEQGSELYLMGLNEFSHRSLSSLRKLLLQKGRSFEQHHKKYKPVILPQVKVPDNVNWTGAGWTHPTERLTNGLQRGWVISALATIEAHLYNATGFASKLSRREIQDCLKAPIDVPFISADVFEYVQQNGIALATFYARGDRSVQACRRRYKRLRERVKIQDHHMLRPYSEENLKIAVALLGPISVNIKVTDKFFFYRTGVFFDYACLDGGPYTNHAVMLVGYGRDPYGGPFWVIQNSWGDHWGEHGFARIARDTLVNCEIPAVAFYPVLFN